MKRILLCAGLLAACLTAASAEDKDKSSASDQTFVTKAAESDLAEINTSNLALKNSGDATVKKFAQQMVQDHTKTSNELTKLASKKNYKLPERMNAEHDKMWTKLSAMKGAGFDKAYADGQVKAHETAVSLFEKESKDGSDADLKAWAKKTLPHLKEHLKMAKDMRSKVGGGKEKR